MRAAVMYGVPDVRIETVPDARINVTATTTQGLKITAQGGGTWTRSETIVLGPGTVFAYGLHKVAKWDGERAEDLEDDWQGPN